MKSYADCVLFIIETELANIKYFRSQPDYKNDSVKMPSKVLETILRHADFAYKAECKIEDELRDWEDERREKRQLEVELIPTKLETLL